MKCPNCQLETYFNGSCSNCGHAESVIEPFPSQFDRQEGGVHYLRLPYDIAQFAEEAKMSPMQFAAFKYIARLGLKGGQFEEQQDIHKAIHFLQMLLEHKHNIRSKITYLPE